MGDVSGSNAKEFAKLVAGHMPQQASHEDVQEIKGDIKELRKEQVAMGKDVAGLKVKSSVWGAIGGGIVAIPVAVMAYFKS